MAKKKAKAARPAATKKKAPAKKAARKSPAKKKVARKSATKKATVKKVAQKVATKKAPAKKVVKAPVEKKAPRVLKQRGVSHDARQLLDAGKYNVIQAAELLQKTYKNSTLEQLKRVCWTQADLARKDHGEKAKTWNPSPRGRRAS